MRARPEEELIALVGRFGAQALRLLVGGHSLLGADDLVICLLSGGGSALLSLPAEGIALEEKRAIIETQIKEVLYNRPNRPRVIGWKDEKGEDFLLQQNQFDKDVEEFLNWH